MASHITVGMARKNLHRHVNPKNENDPQFLAFLNQVSERFTDDAAYKGNIIEALFETDTQGCITCPPHMDSVMAAVVNGGPIPVYSEWHRYVEVGPGYIQSDVQNGFPFYDLGDKFCTVADIPVGSEGPLRTTIVSAQDAGKKNRYFGKDIDGNEIIGPDNELGELVTLTFPTTTTVNNFATVDRIIKQPSAGRQTLAWMDGIVANTLCVYQPGETVPLYHRYQIGTVREHVTLGRQTIAIKGRRRHMEMVSENDPVYPPSYGALKFGLLAIISENAPSDALRATASNYWADAYLVASKLTKKTKGSSRKMLNFSPRGAGVRPVINSH